MDAFMPTDFHFIVLQWCIDMNFQIETERMALIIFVTYNVEEQKDESSQERLPMQNRRLWSYQREEIIPLLTLIEFGYTVINVHIH